jgi:starch phosphorylase
MKLMINGALTIGTLDGANVEMQAATGAENMFIFGLTAQEVEQLWMSGYRAASFYTANEKLARIVNQLTVGFAGESFADIAAYLLNGYGVADPYMCMADFESYRTTHERMISTYQNDKDEWLRMSLINIAAAGHFAADRSIEEYAQRIWNLKKVK